MTAGTESPAPTRSARRVAIQALTRISDQGAYANLVVPALLDDSGLADRDRRLVTHLVYGTTRMRRACDALIDPWLSRRPEPQVRSALRLGAYQLAFLGTPDHAAVAETVAAAPGRARGFVNAVLRRVAEAPVAFEGDAVALSYPDWVLGRLEADLGTETARTALAAMNEPAAVTERADGYIQDRGSQLVVEAVGARPGEVVADQCAAPGGKATGLAARDARVLASDRRPGRAGLVVANRDRLGIGSDRLAVAVADGRRPPWPKGRFDRVLVDAPCSGLGALARRPDARWRLDPDSPERLARLQGALLAAAVPLLAPGGVLVYAVCTLTRVEGPGVAAGLTDAHPGLSLLDPPGDPWRPWEGGARLDPHAAGTDGMVLYRWQRRGDAP